MRCLWLKAHEVPEIVMGRLSLRNVVVRLWLDSVYEVGKLDSILNKKDWYIVADKVPIAFLSVEFDGKATDVANGVLKAGMLIKLVRCGKERKHTALPLEPCTVLKRKNTGVLRVGSVRTGA
jgi:hypothetical protein